MQAYHATTRPGPFAAAGCTGIYVGYVYTSYIYSLRVSSSSQSYYPPSGLCVCLLACWYLLFALRFVFFYCVFSMVFILWVMTGLVVVLQFPK